MTRKHPQARPLATDKVLTPAETRVASGYVCGLIGKEIADACDISHNTVVRHTQNIYDKTGIRRSTNSLVAWFLSENFNIDLKESGRRLVAVALFIIMGAEALDTDISSSLVRRFPSRRIEARKGGSGRGRRREDECDLYGNDTL